MPSEIKGSSNFDSDNAGKVLQVVSAIKTDAFSSTSTTPVNITGLSASITPSSTSSKILVSCTLSYGGVQNSFASMRFAANGTGIALGTGATGSAHNETTSLSLDNQSAAPYHIYPAAFEYLHSPNTTSAVVYTVQARSDSGLVFNINYPNLDSTNAYTMHGVSTITVMEIGA